MDLPGFGLHVLRRFDRYLHGLPGPEPQRPLPQRHNQCPHNHDQHLRIVVQQLCHGPGFVRHNRNDQKWIRIWLLATAFLGAIFIGFQIFEFNSFKNEGLTLGANLFGATFFTLTGFHGAHVTIGIIWLLGMFVVAMKGRLGPASSLDVEILGLYWHFVDIVWIIIFTLLYLIAGFDTGPAPLAGG